VYGYQYVYTKVQGLPQEEFGHLDELAREYGAHDSEWKDDNFFWAYFKDTEGADAFLEDVQVSVERNPEYGEFKNWTIK
jgi:hypothetical protein